jgi:hypothetical protein
VVFILDQTLQSIFYRVPFEKTKYMGYLDKNAVKRVLLVEPPGGFIRLDRCMQSINSWGGVYRFPLNLCRIAASFFQSGMYEIDVRFIDLQADPNADLGKILFEFQPELCILSCGFPSMQYDVECANRIKRILPKTHVSTFGVVPTLLGSDFFKENVWSFSIPFDSIVTGGEPAVAYQFAVFRGTEWMTHSQTICSQPETTKGIWTLRGRRFFDHSLYRSPFTGEIQTYVEGSYGCPKKCGFCVVPSLYGGSFSKRSAKDIVLEFQFAIERNNVQQISLWDEGTTFQRTQIKEICEGLIELRKSSIPAFQNFSWNTRSTTALLDEETISLMKQSGLTGLTLGLESFDETVLQSTHKGTTVANNLEAIRLLKQFGIYSIGHIVLGLPEETRESAEHTIHSAYESGLDVAQFYCAVPYPGTPLHKQASELGLIRVHDLTKYELCNPIMDTLGGLSHLEIGELRRQAMRLFQNRQLNIDMLHNPAFAEWSKR